MWSLLLIGIIAVLAAEPVVTIATATADEMLEGNRSKGRKVFQKNCRTCHSVRPEKDGTFGPNLHGVVGRQVATEPRHNYSAALKNVDFIWDLERLNAWLKNLRRVRTRDEIRPELYHAFASIACLYTILKTF